jgi:enamine deaminase RidA (YjgF/YER057c/UK114 family)
MTLATTPEERLIELAIALPAPLPGLTGHAPLVVSRGLAFVSGHGPLDAQRNPVYAGRLGAELAEEDGFAAARLAALNTLASLRQALGSLDRVRRVVKLTGFVLSAPDFKRQPWVVDGASALFTEVFGTERGTHARTSVGVFATPLDMAITIETVFEVEDR